MKNYSGYIYVILSAVIFGLSPLFTITIMSNGGETLSILMYRVLFSAPVLFILMKRTPNLALTITKAEFRKIFILCQSNIFTGIFLIASYAYISSGTSTTIHFIYPVLVLIGCALFFKERVTLIKIICVVLSVLGIFMFYVPGDDGSFIGIVLAFISGITYAFHVIYLSKSGLQNMNSYKLLFYLNIMSSLEIFIYMVFTNSLQNNMTLFGWFISFVFAMVFTVGFIAFQRGVKGVGPTKASILSTFEPITSIIISVLVYKEGFSFKSFIGIVLILISVILITLFDKDKVETEGESVL